MRQECLNSWECVSVVQVDVLTPATWKFAPCSGRVRSKQSRATTALLYKNHTCKWKRIRSHCSLEAPRRCGGPCQCINTCRPAPRGMCVPQRNRLAAGTCRSTPPPPSPGHSAAHIIPRRSVTPGLPSHAAAVATWQLYMGGTPLHPKPLPLLQNRPPVPPLVTHPTHAHVNKKARQAQPRRPGGNILGSVGGSIPQAMHAENKAARLLGLWPSVLHRRQRPRGGQHHGGQHHARVGRHAAAAAASFAFKRSTSGSWCSPPCGRRGSWW